jgi:5-amino-6-(5-phospho-D-ribitylamino)uracil phosphatase
MKYKVLMLDVDGTLSPYSKTEMPMMPSDCVVQAIKKAEGSLLIGLATSRPLSKIKEIIRITGLNGPSILSNGAQIIDSNTLNSIWEKPVNSTALEKLFDISQHYKIDTYFSNFSENIHVESKQQLLSIPVADFFFDGINFQDKEFVDAEISTIEGIAIHRMSSKWVDKFELSITNTDATKLHAINEVARIVGIDTSEIIGVGDGYNDIPLLEACGLKVAMGNAVEELKQIADFIVPSVDEDGIKVLIGNLLFKK